MRKGRTELVMILDRSGSMGGLERDTIGGFNSMMERQKQEAGEALVSVVLFDHQREVLYDRMDIQKIPPMTEKEYYVRGSTALLDAVGFAIRHIERVQSLAPEMDVPEKTVFVITTDGMENASTAYTYPDVKRLISRMQEEKGWEFLFLGANIDAAAEAEHLGIRQGRYANYTHDKQGTMLGYEAMDMAVRAARSAAPEEMDLRMEAAFAPVQRDYEERKGKRPGSRK